MIFFDDGIVVVVVWCEEILYVVIEIIVFEMVWIEKYIVIE